MKCDHCGKSGARQVMPGVPLYLCTPCIEKAKKEGILT